MNADLILEFDAAAQAIDALGGAATEPRASIEGRLGRDIADLRMHGLDDSWHIRWIHGPLRAIRVLEGLRLKLMVELDEARHELRQVDADLSLLREAGRIADAEFAARKAVRLLCHEADLKERLDVSVSHRITAARNGIARILEVSLRQAGREAMRLARESGQPGSDPALARESFARAESYNRLVAEAHRVTGGVDVPVFLPDHVARLREASAATVAGAGQGPDGLPAGAAMPTVKVPVITQELLAARAAVKAARATTTTLGASRPPSAGPAAVAPLASAPRVAATTGVAPRRPAAVTAPRAAAAAPGAAADPPARSDKPAGAPKTQPSLPRLRNVIVGA
jgi:hypothetical protein